MATAFTTAQCEAKLSSLSSEYDSLISRPFDSTDPEGARLTERRLSELDAAIDKWTERLQAALADASTTTAQAIKLIRRRPA